MDRRRMMMQSGGSGGGWPDNPYIKDGLIFQLDGIHKGSDDTWVELVNNIPMLTIGTPQRFDDHFYYDGSSAHYASKEIDLSAAMCIEVVFKATNTGSSGNRLFHANSATGKGICFIPQGSGVNGFWWGERNSGGYRCTYSLSSPFGAKKYFGLHESFGCWNGTRLNKTTNKNGRSGGTTNRPSVGAAVNTSAYGRYELGYTSISEIYAIRIYNRELTLEELQSNYAIDKERFGL